MKQVSNDYKNQINQMGREIDSIITYYNHYKMITENDHYILTEDGVKINTEQIKTNSYVEIGAEDIYSCKVITHGELLKTMMKEFDFEVKQEMNVGSIVKYKFGVKVNGQFEYVDLGNFVVQEKEYNEDTFTYSYKAYDIMLKSMIPYKDTATYPTTLYGLLNSVLEYCEIEIGVSEFPNSERNIYDNPFQNMDITCRDVLDLITEVTGCSSYIYENVFIINGPSDSNLTLTANSFKDTNVKFNKMYGPINSILFSRNEGLDVIEYKDDTSIEENGVTQIVIKDNPLLNGNDRSDYFEEMFNILGGLTYSINDISSTGITYLEYLDLFKVNIDNNEYQCLLLNDEINVVQGLEENIFTEEIEETTQEYTTGALSDKEQKWANINVRKEVGEIALEVGEKVGKSEVISSINLTPESATINANKVNLNGYVTITDLATSGATTINGSNITTGSINASLITTGNLSANRITSGQLIMSGYSQGHPFINLGNLTDPRYPYGIEVWDNCILLSDYRDGGLSYIRTANGDGYAELSGASCNAFAFNNLSLEEKKKNFEKLEKALDIVKDTDIYKYNYKGEKDNRKKHIGVIIGKNYKYKEDITNEDNNSIDIYSMVSVLWQAVQEQQEQIEELKKKVK